MESASSDSVDVDEIKDLLTCSLCSRTLNEPRILPCFHNFCKVCLGEFLYLEYLLSTCAMLWMGIYTRLLILYP